MPPAAEAAKAGEQLLHFFEYHPPERVSRNLRRMMMEFLMTDNGIEADYLKDLLYDLEGLFEFLNGLPAHRRLHGERAGAAQVGKVERSERLDKVWTK